MVLPLPELQPGAVKGSTWWVDHFGNVQTNISPADLASINLSEGAAVALRLGADRHDLPWVRAYGDANPGAIVVITDSQGLIAISVVGGSAAERLGIGIDREVVFTRDERQRLKVQAS